MRADAVGVVVKSLGADGAHVVLTVTEILGAPMRLRQAMNAFEMNAQL